MARNGKHAHSLPALCPAEAPGAHRTRSATYPRECMFAPVRVLVVNDDITSRRHGRQDLRSRETGHTAEARRTRSGQADCGSLRCTRGSRDYDAHRQGLESRTVALAIERGPPPILPWFLQTLRPRSTALPPIAPVCLHACTPGRPACPPQCPARNDRYHVHFR